MNTARQHPYRLIVISVAAGFLLGCGNTPATISAPPVALSSKQWEGVWEGTGKSYFGHESRQAIRIQSGGKGSVVTSAMYEPRHQPPLWVQEIPFSWEVINPSEMHIVLDEAQTLAGGGSWGMGAKRKGVLSLKSTEQGLVLDALGIGHVAFKKTAKPLGGNIGHEIAQDTRNRTLTMGGNPDTTHQGSTTGEQVAAAFMAGAGLGAASNKEYGLAQQFLNQASASLAGKQSSQGGAGKDIMGNVTLGDSEMSAYTDGKAYDVITMMPTTDGKSAGEWCYQYGLPVGNARSLLATGFAMAGDRSEYGPGNPRDSISWRSYPVRKGQTIRMGMEWKRGQAVVTPYPNRQATRPL